MAKARTLDDLLSAHDPDVVIPNKITAALASLLKEGPEHHEAEVDFIRRAKLSNNTIGPYRDKFRAHYVLVGGSRNPKRVWFGDAKVAAKARAKLGNQD